jgi:hypothetical protein
MNNKKGNLWRDQVTEVIVKLKREGTGFEDWVDWDIYVRSKVMEGVLKAQCLSIWVQGGEKKASVVERVKNVAAISPLKTKKPLCTGHHDFKADDKKDNARKGSGYNLDGIVCAGINSNCCKKEFVEKVEDATDPANAEIVSQRNPAQWCRKCHLVLCHACHMEYVLSKPTGRERRKKLQF